MFGSRNFLTATQVLLLLLFAGGVNCQGSTQPSFAGHVFNAFQSGNNVTLSAAAVIPSGNTTYIDVVFPDIQLPAQACGERFFRCNATMIFDPSSNKVVTVLAVGRGAAAALFNRVDSTLSLIDQQFISLPNNPTCTLTAFVRGGSLWYGLCYEFVSDTEVTVVVYRLTIDFNSLSLSSLTFFNNRNSISPFSLSEAFFSSCSGFANVYWFGDAFLFSLRIDIRSPLVENVLEIENMACYGNGTRQVELFQNDALLVYCGQNTTTRIDICPDFGSAILLNTTYFCLGNESITLEVESGNLRVSLLTNYVVPFPLDTTIRYRGDCVYVDSQLFFVATAVDGLIVLTNVFQNFTTVLSTDSPVNHQVIQNRFISYSTSDSSILLDLSCPDPASPIHVTNMSFDLSAFSANNDFSCLTVQNETAVEPPTNSPPSVEPSTTHPSVEPLTNSPPSVEPSTSSPPTTPEPTVSTTTNILTTTQPTIGTTSPPPISAIPTTPPTFTMTTTNPSPTGSSNVQPLSGGAVAGIAIAVVTTALVACLVVTIVFCIWKKKRSKYILAVPESTQRPAQTRPIDLTSDSQSITNRDDIRLIKTEEREVPRNNEPSDIPESLSLEASFSDPHSPSSEAVENQIHLQSLSPHDQHPHSLLTASPNNEHPVLGAPQDHTPPADSSPEGHSIPPPKFASNVPNPPHSTPSSPTTSNTTVSAPSSQESTVSTEGVRPQQRASLSSHSENTSSEKLPTLEPADVQPLLPSITDIPEVTVSTHQSNDESLASSQQPSHNEDTITHPTSQNVHPPHIVPTIVPKHSNTHYENVNTPASSAETENISESNATEKLSSLDDNATKIIFQTDSNRSTPNSCSSTPTTTSSLPLVSSVPVFHDDAESALITPDVPPLPIMKQPPALSVDRTAGLSQTTSNTPPAHDFPSGISTPSLPPVSDDERLFSPVQATPDKPQRNDGHETQVSTVTGHGNPVSQRNIHFSELEQKRDEDRDIYKAKKLEGWEQDTANPNVPHDKPTIETDRTTEERTTEEPDNEIGFIPQKPKVPASAAIEGMPLLECIDDEKAENELGKDSLSSDLNMSSADNSSGEFVQTDKCLNDSPDPHVDDTTHDQDDIAGAPSACEPTAHDQDDIVDSPPSACEPTAHNVKDAGPLDES